MKNFILLLGFMLFAGMAMGQMKVISNGMVKVGDTSVDPTEQLEVDGNVLMSGESLNTGFVSTTTNRSASALFHRTDRSAFTMGAGVNAGFRVDENFHLEFRSGPRFRILERNISTGTLLMRFERNTGDVGIGIGSPTEKLHVSGNIFASGMICLLYTSPSPRDRTRSRMPSSA